MLHRGSDAPPTVNRVCLLVCLFCALWQLPLHAQVLRGEENDPNSPAYDNVRPQPGPALESQVRQLREQIKELQQSNLDAAGKQAALDQLLRDYDDMLRGHPTWLDRQ